MIILNVVSVFRVYLPKSIETLIVNNFLINFSFAHSQLKSY